jgi:2-aminoethylphosphonate-pyruvate transaminase
MTGRHVLLTPGPVNVGLEVRQALQRTDVGHREPEALAALDRVRAKATTVFGGDSGYDTVVLTGSGTSGLESVISSVIPRGGRLLVLENGRFGRRIAEIAATHRIALTVLSFDWNEAVRPEVLAAALQADSTVTHVAVVHHETSTGLLNPVGLIGAVTAAAGVTLIVDAVSSLGAEPLDIAADHIDWCVSSANKCLESVPGLSLVCAPRARWEALRFVEPTTFSLNLYQHWKAQQIAGEPLFTPAVQLLFALDAALDSLLLEGTPGRAHRYRSISALLRRGLAERNLRMALPDHLRSASVTVCELPESVPFPYFQPAMRKAGFAIYSAPAHLGNACGIATMGQLTADDVLGFLNELDALIATSRTASTRCAVADGSMR